MKKEEAKVLCGKKKSSRSHSRGTILKSGQEIKGSTHHNVRKVMQGGNAFYSIG